jgi:hypothetical protein
MEDESAPDIPEECLFTEYISKAVALRQQYVWELTSAMFLNSTGTSSFNIQQNSASDEIGQFVASTTS